METNEQTPKQDRPGYSPYKLGVGVSVVLVLASIFLFLSFFSLWANRQLLDSEQWTKTSTELLERPAVQNALANYMVDQLFSQVDVEGEITQQLPKDWEVLASPATSALRSLTLTGTKRVLELPVTQEAWAAASDIAHRNLIVMLEGGNAAVNTERGTITINAREILQQAANKVGVSGNLISKIPANAGSFEIYQSDDLSTLQTAYKTFKNLTWIFALITVLLYAAAIALATGRRRRAVLWMGASLTVVGLLVMITISLGRGPVVDSLAQTNAVVPAVGEVFDISTELLRHMANSLFFTGLLVLIAATFAGPYRWAIRGRELLAPYLRDQLPIAAGAAVLLFLIVLWIAPVSGFRTSVGIAINVSLAIAGFIALVFITRREFPDAEAYDFSEAGDWIARQWDGARGFVSEKTKDIELPNFAGGPDKTEAITAELPADAPTAELHAAEPGAAAEGDKVDRLERLAKLHASGALTDEEFAAGKGEILGS